MIRRYVLFACLLSPWVSPWGADPLPFTNDLESIDSTCYASRPNDDENSVGCGPFSRIGVGTTGSTINLLGRWGFAHSGSYAVRIRYAANEERSAFRLDSMNTQHIFVRFWMFIDPNYDHAYGEKILRLDALDVGGSAYYEPICYIRSTGATAGKDPMASVNCEANGGSGGPGGGGSFGGASIVFPFSAWFELQFEFYINDTGDNNGICRIWYNDSLISEQTALDNMRTSGRGGGYNHLTDNHNITDMSYGGWYSGGAHGPNVPAIKYIDDVCAQTTKCASLVGGGGTPPTVTVDPSNATVTAPSSATFNVTATGDATLTYQWQRGSTNVSTGIGGTTASYTTAATSVGADNGATFRCIVTNSSGVDTSAAATLTVNAASSANRRAFGGMAPSFRRR
jgi:hypothetical protein